MYNSRYNSVSTVTTLSTSVEAGSNFLPVEILSLPNMVQTVSEATQPPIQ